MRKFHALDSGIKAAINESFLQNIKTGKSQLSVGEALKEFYGKDKNQK